MSIARIAGAAPIADDQRQVLGLYQRFSAPRQAVGRMAAHRCGVVQGFLTKLISVCVKTVVAMVQNDAS